MNDKKMRSEELFHRVADRSLDTREQIFSDAKISDETRREVEEMVELDSVFCRSVEEGIGSSAAQALAQFQPGDPGCGPYRIGALLGRGGMGAVYAAERVDGEVSQRVAVKMLRPGADDPSSRQRFLAERQILAVLSHPNIARLLDAGHRDDGQPYLVMEYVEGQPIDEYTAALGIRPTICLFLKVCAAVSYLHRNLVVHRDLKPSNILVTPEGEPKVLDFGIAKILDPAPDTTITMMRMLTPDYASPEQMLGGAITTASDVYSLGTVLYKLLTGASPRPSETNGRMLTAEEMGKITRPSKWRPELKGDLEFILMKALRAEPEQRYATVDQFAEDLENYLVSRPIRARKGGSWYRARKHLRRHWLAAAATAFAVVSLSAGLLLANQERDIARRRYTQVRQLANKLFDIDAEVRLVPGTAKARELIVNTSVQYLRALAADVHGDPEIALELGNAYMRVARVQGVPILTNLGQTVQAGQNLLVAKGYIDSVLAAEPANRTALLRAAQIAHDRMILVRDTRDNEQALALARDSAQFLHRFRAREGDESEAGSILATYVNVADQFMLSEQYEEALRLCKEGTDTARMLKRTAYLGSLLTVSADVFRKTGDLDGALRDIREAAAILESGPNKAEHARVMNLVLALINEGKILAEETDINMGRPDEAIGPLQRAFTIADSAVHLDAKDQNSRGRLAVAGLVLGNILRQSDARKSLELFDHVLRHVGEIQGNLSFRRYEVSALAGSSGALLQLGRRDEAKARISAAFSRLAELHLYPAEKIDPSLEADEALSASAAFQAATGQYWTAIEINKELLQKVMATGLKPETSLSDAFQLSRIYGKLAGLEGRIGKGSSSEYAGLRLTLWQHWSHKLPDNPFVRSQLHAARQVGRKSGDGTSVTPIS